jgi:hypothetical protein
MIFIDAFIDLFVRLLTDIANLMKFRIWIVQNGLNIKPIGEEYGIADRVLGAWQLVLYVLETKLGFFREVLQTDN